MMEYEIIRNKHDIEETLAECDRCIAEHISSEQSYYEGVAAAIRWLINSWDEEPVII